MFQICYERVKNTEKFEGGKSATLACYAIEFLMLPLHDIGLSVAVLLLMRTLRRVVLFYKGRLCEFLDLRLFLSCRFHRG